MRAVIIFFSQTGNTEKIANILRQGIMDSGNYCDIVNIKDFKVKALKHYDLIGIGTPTFFYREPFNVRSFIQGLPGVKDKHCFLFCTHGSIIGNTFYYMSEGLKEKGFIITGVFDTYSDSSIQFYPEVMHTAGHPDNIELEEAEKFGETICSVTERIKEGEAGLAPEFEPVLDTWWAEQSNMLTPEFLRKVSPAFSVDMDKCTQCLTCQDSCPVDAVDILADPPELQKEGCISCWFCEKNCPEGAIMADWSAMKQGAPGNLKKYIEELKKAEQEGRFRPYVDYEKIY